MHEVGAADDTDHATAAGDRKPLDVVPLHGVDDRFEQLVLTDGPWIGGHDVFDFSARTVRIFLRELARPDDEFEPFRPLPLGAQFTTAKKIALGHHADQLTLLIDDRQAADAILKHQARRFEDWFVRANANDVRCHYVFDSHGHILILEIAGSDPRR